MCLQDMLTIIRRIAVSESPISNILLRAWSVLWSLTGQHLNDYYGISHDFICHKAKNGTEDALVPLISAQSAANFLL